jgi:hypothetical protein
MKIDLASSKAGKVLLLVDTRKEKVCEVYKASWRTANSLARRTSVYNDIWTLNILGRKVTSRING